MSFDGSRYTEQEIAQRLSYRAGQLERMLALDTPQIILDQQRAMVREVALALPPGKDWLEEE